MQANKVKRYLALPLQLAPLLFIAVFSGLTVLAASAGLLGIPLGLLVFFGFIRYSFALLDATVNGATEPPILSIEMMNPVGETRSLAVLAFLAAVFFGTGAASYWMGPAVQLIAGLAVAMILLAVIAVQGATGSVPQALDPRRWFGLMLRLGADYGLIVGCAAALYLLGCWVAGWTALPLAVRVALLMYAWLAVFALIGGVLRERRHDIGLDEADEPEPVELDASAAIRKERDLQVDRIYGQWRSGAYKNAWQTIAVQLESSADPIGELRWLYERIARWPDRRLADRLAQELVAQLLTAKRHGEMLRLLDEQLRANPDFRPLTSNDLIRAVRIARDGGDRRIARALLKDFQRLYPGDALQKNIEALRQETER